MDYNEHVCIYFIFNINNMAEEPTKKPGININVDPDKLESKYSDSVFINFSPFGFTFDFAQNIPQMKIVKVLSRVSFSPQHTKAFLNVLQNQVKNYENKFGEINITPDMQQQADKHPIGFDTDD